LRDFFGIGLGPQNRIGCVVHPALDRCNEFVIPFMISSKNLSDERSLPFEDAIIFGFPNQGVLHSHTAAQSHRRWASESRVRW